MSNTDITPNKSTNFTVKPKKTVKFVEMTSDKMSECEDRNELIPNDLLSEHRIQHLERTIIELKMKILESEIRVNQLEVENLRLTATYNVKIHNHTQSKKQ